MTSTASRPRLQKSDAVRSKELTPVQDHVMREHGTERAFTGPYWAENRSGTYACVCCGTPLFSSATKFDSGTGWPSLFLPLAGDVIEEHQDRSVGHVFGPKPTGQRDCMNAPAPAFAPDSDVEPDQ